MKNIIFVALFTLTSCSNDFKNDDLLPILMVAKENPKQDICFSVFSHLEMAKGKYCIKFKEELKK